MRSIGSNYSSIAIPLQPLLRHYRHCHDGDGCHVLAPSANDIALLASVSVISGKWGFTRHHHHHRRETNSTMNKNSKGYPGIQPIMSLIKSLYEGINICQDAIEKNFHIFAQITTRHRGGGRPAILKVSNRDDAIHLSGRELRRHLQFLWQRITEIVCDLFSISFFVYSARQQQWPISELTNWWLFPCSSSKLKIVLSPCTHSIILRMTTFSVNAPLYLQLHLWYKRQNPYIAIKLSQRPLFIYWEYLLSPICILSSISSYYRLTKGQFRYYKVR